MRLLYIWLAVFCSLAFCSSTVLAQKAPTCEEQAKKPIEELYCEIKSRSPRTRLPNIHEFRRNPEKTQRLLLKRPAKKLGLSLPEAKKPLKSKKRTRTKSKAPSKRYNTPEDGLSNYCTLNKKVVTCDNIKYHLQDNIPNSKLAKGALLLDEKVKFALFVGNKNQNSDVIPYLKEGYLHYIEQMLKIGLGASTMSFTKFYHTFMEVQSKKVSFSARMTKMFVYLKKDKATIGVKRRFNNLLPPNLNQCSTLSEQIIACDNVKQTWIYQQKQSGG